jgi:hypothetical protein
MNMNNHGTQIPKQFIVDFHLLLAIQGNVVSSFSSINKNTSKVQAFTGEVSFCYNKMRDVFIFNLAT